MATRTLLLVDDGLPRSWKPSWVWRILGTLFFAGFCTFATLIGNAWVVIPELLAAGGWWVLVARLRIDLTSDRLRMRCIRDRGVPLVDVVEAASGYWGFHVRLVAREGELWSRMVSSPLLPTANWRRWFGVLSAGDVAAGLVMMRAGVARGGQGEPVLLEGRRGAGNLSMAALWAAILGH